MNNKGFALIDLMICIAIIGILVAIIWPNITRRNQIVEENKSDQELKIKTEQYEKSRIKITKSIIECLDGKQIIEIDGKVYWLGDDPDSWGDLKSLPCE